MTVAVAVPLAGLGGLHQDSAFRIGCKTFCRLFRLADLDHVEIKIRTGFSPVRPKGLTEDLNRDRLSLIRTRY